MISQNTKMKLPAIDINSTKMIFKFLSVKFNACLYIFNHEQHLAAKLFPPVMRDKDVYVTSMAYMVSTSHSTISSQIPVTARKDWKPYQVIFPKMNYHTFF